ncbi:VWA domain-containing protein [Methanosphaera sp. ISO3-F5]|uniref:VWA domain-containing protein n=1 Tax=Methanosphaera sp. ISO3-F5 TaxID=1452353 RepID=UPI002B262F97|nr:VWA domain-containing protein [Methanosphaera sp. ISO3-F5]WQH65048.1 VWA domain-containing protein [Methanosphaera sp. ISO3-F5]
MNKIVLLSNYLRKEGMPVSIRSTSLAMEVVETLGKSMTVNELYNSLKVIYVKNLEDYDKFDRVFNKIFTNVNIKSRKNNRKKQDHEEVVLEEVTGEDLIFNQNEDLDQLEQLYDEMIEYNSETKASQGKLVNQSMLLLDNFDQRLFELCKKLSRKIANKRSKRRKKNNSHHIDMTRTIRANIKNGGHIMKLIYDKPPMKKTKHIFLCDVSGSCEWVTSWFFLLLYGCINTFDKVKVYDFDNRLIDVTDLLLNEHFGTIGQVNVAQRSKGILCYGQSDMVKSFKEFLDEAEITHRTDIIILTDCRDWKGKRVNGVLESATLMKHMVQKANRVIILNPEKKIRWNNATSCVQDYEDVGVEIYETSSLDKFEKVISQL